MRRYSKMTREKSAQMHAAKARKRMDEPPPDYQPLLDYEAPIESWTFRDYRRGRTHKLVLFHSRRRRGSFRVLVNGKEWSKCIGYDRLIRKTGKALNGV
jgi:hypothetical protein